MNNFPIFVKVSKTISGVISKKQVKQNVEICYSYLPAPDFQDEIEYRVVETGEIRKHRPYDNINGFVIFVTEKTYKELNIKRQFCVHYIMSDEKSDFNGWRADYGLSSDSKNELLRITMEKNGAVRLN